MEGWGWSDDVVFVTEADYIALCHWKTGTILTKLMLPPNMPRRVNDHVRMSAGSMPWRTLWHPDKPWAVGEFLEGHGYVKLIRWDLEANLPDLKAKVAELNAKVK